MLMSSNLAVWHTCMHACKHWCNSNHCMAYMHACIGAAAITLYGTHVCVHSCSSNLAIWHTCVSAFVQQQSSCMAHMWEHMGEHTYADRYQSFFADTGYFSKSWSEVWTTNTVCSSLMMMGYDVLINDGLANSDCLGHYSCSSKWSVTSLKTRRLSR